jgi:hypothetical protein
LKLAKTLLVWLPTVLVHLQALVLFPWFLVVLYLLAEPLLAQVQYK